MGAYIIDECVTRHRFWHIGAYFRTQGDILLLEWVFHPMRRVRIDGSWGHVNRAAQERWAGELSEQYGAIRIRLGFEVKMRVVLVRKGLHKYVTIFFTFQNVI